MTPWRKRQKRVVVARTARRVVRGGNNDDRDDDGGGNYVDEIPDVLLNCYLIQAGVRPAALLETINYGEKAATDPRTAEILSLVHATFPPDVIEETETDYGIFLSSPAIAEKIRSADLSDSVVRGELLGYPCAADTEDNFAIHVVTTYRSKPFAIISNVATDLSKLDQFRKIAAAANAVIQANNTLLADYGKVTVETRKLTTIADLINMIMAGERLSAEDTQQLKDVLSDEFYGKNQHFIDNFDSIVDVTNPVHIGILLALLVDQHVKPWSPLYPIHHLPQYAEVKHGLEQVGENLLSVLNYTKMAKPAIRITATNTTRGATTQRSSSSSRPMATKKKKPWR